jgi:hypothetical protein
MDDAFGNACKSVKASTVQGVYPQLLPETFSIRSLFNEMNVEGFPHYI